jgi:hypothetical protein
MKITKIALIAAVPALLAGCAMDNQPSYSPGYSNDTVYVDGYGNRHYRQRDGQRHYRKATNSYYGASRAAPPSTTGADSSNVAPPSTTSGNPSMTQNYNVAPPSTQAGNPSVPSGNPSVPTANSGSTSNTKVIMRHRPAVPMDNAK